MKKVCVFFVIFILASQGYAVTETIVKETKGQGKTRAEAIKNALVNAVSQVKGVSVDSEDANLDYQSAKVSTDSLEIDAVSVETSGQTVAAKTAGMVKTYEVLEEKKIDDETYEVKLKAWVYDYSLPLQNNRDRFAVMPVNTLKKNYYFNGNIVSAEELSQKLTDKLTAAFTKTNKFAMLDRQYICDFVKNKNILAYGQGSTEEKEKLRQVLGADYMLSGTISEAKLTSRKKYLKAIDRTTKEYELDFIFDYKMIVAPTTQIKLADTVKFTLKTNEVKQLVTKWDHQSIDTKELLENLVTKVANQAAGKTIDLVYPIRIADIGQNGQVIINQGGDRIAIGTVLSVVRQGQEIVDFDTKESLGKTESCIAKIKVIKTVPKFSYAEIMEGDLAKITEGLICRIEK